MHRFDRKDALGLLMVLLPIAAIPLTLFALRPRPLSGENATELSNAVLDARQDKILDQMMWRYEAASLKMDDGPDPEDSPDFRWQKIRDEMEESGAEPHEAAQVVQAARQNLKDEWPCLAEHAILRGKLVWVVAGSTKHHAPYMDWPWACIPNAESLRERNIEIYCTNSKATIIDARAPYRTLK